MTEKIWDPFIRAFHWAVALGFTANLLLTRPGKTTHRYIGYALLALLALRLIWGFLGPRWARFTSFPPSPRAALGHLAEMATGRRHAHKGHSPLGALMVYNMLLTLLLTSLTGYGLTTLAFFGVEWMEELHELSAYWLALSAAVHVAAVLFESRRLGINLPKSMITGYKSGL